MVSLKIIWAATGYALVLGTGKQCSCNTLAGASGACPERSRESRSARWQSLLFPSASYRCYPDCV